MLFFGKTLFSSGNIHYNAYVSREEFKETGVIAFLCLLNLPSAFVVLGRIATDEESLVLLKPVEQFSFTYGVSRVMMWGG